MPNFSENFGKIFSQIEPFSFQTRFSNLRDPFPSLKILKIKLFVRSLFSKCDRKRSRNRNSTKRTLQTPRNKAGQRYFEDWEKCFRRYNTSRGNCVLGNQESSIVFLMTDTKGARNAEKTAIYSSKRLYAPGYLSPTGDINS